MAGSVSGLVSGLDTQSIISQLMQVEAAGQTRLKSKVNTEQKAVTAYQSVNTKLAALKKTAADDIGKLSTWRSAASTSSSSTVKVATTSSNATATGSVTFDVVSLAKSQVSTTRAVSTGDATSQGTVSLTKGDGTTPTSTSPPTARWPASPAPSTRPASASRPPWSPWRAARACCRCRRPSPA